MILAEPADKGAPAALLRSSDRRNSMIFRSAKRQTLCNESGHGIRKQTFPHLIIQTRTIPSSLFRLLVVTLGLSCGEILTTALEHHVHTRVKYFGKLGHRGIHTSPAYFKSCDEKSASIVNYLYLAEKLLHPSALGTNVMCPFSGIANSDEKATKSQISADLDPFEDILILKDANHFMTKQKV
jgi:hypothetical protein